MPEESSLRNEYENVNVAERGNDAISSGGEEKGVKCYVYKLFQAVKR